MLINDYREHFKERKETTKPFKEKFHNKKLEKFMLTTQKLYSNLQDDEDKLIIERKPKIKIDEHTIKAEASSIKYYLQSHINNIASNIQNSSSKIIKIIDKVESPKQINKETTDNKKVIEKKETKKNKESKKRKDIIENIMSTNKESIDNKEIIDNKEHIDNKQNTDKKISSSLKENNSNVYVPLPEVKKKKNITFQKYTNKIIKPNENDIKNYFKSLDFLPKKKINNNNNNNNNNNQLDQSRISVSSKKSEKKNNSLRKIIKKSFKEYVGDKDKLTKIIDEIMESQEKEEEDDNNSDEIGNVSEEIKLVNQSILDFKKSSQRSNIVF